MRRRKSSKALPFITQNTSEIGESPWRTMLQNASLERSTNSACREILAPCSDACTCVVVDFTLLNPEEILLALEENGLYDITEERHRHSIQL